MNQMRFCPYCGGPLMERLLDTEDRPRLVCGRCDSVLYENPRIVAAALPLNERGVVLLRRGIEPRKGAWTFPSGYMELGESVEEAAVRETKEETNLDVELLSLLHIYSRREVGVVVIVYLARIIGGAAGTSRETLEVAEFAADQIPWDELAFPSTIWALQDWVDSLRDSDLDERSADTAHMPLAGPAGDA